jgi:dGTPase
VLKLNLELIECISLAHDIGHSPGGHSAEMILNDISKKYKIGGFNHNAQGIRWLHYLEKRFPKKPAQGLNLTLQVLDGVLCHDGEINEQKLKPIKINGKSWEDHFKEYDDCFNEDKIKRIPMSYEGVVVRFADTISYVGRDIEDAVLLKFIKRSDIPNNCKKVLGDTNRKIINSLIMDLLDFSLENDGEYIGYSEEIFGAIKELKVFNYENIYIKRDLIKKNNSKITFMDELRHKYEFLFEMCLKDLEDLNYDAPIFKDHIEYIDDSNYSSYFLPLKNDNKLILIVRDFIAGCSDKYFDEIYNIYHNKK